MNFIALPTVFQVANCVVLWTINLPIAAKIALSAVAIVNCILFLIVADYPNCQLVVNCVGLICISLCVVQAAVSYGFKNWTLFGISTLLDIIECIWYILMIIWASRRGDK